MTHLNEISYFQNLVSNSGDLCPEFQSLNSHFLSLIFNS